MSMKTPEQPKLDTYLQHVGMAEFDPHSGAAPVALPPYRASTVRFESLAALEQVGPRKAKGERAVRYGRSGLDTHAAFEDAVCQLEGGRHAYLASSGLAAITLGFLSFLSQGDHVLVADCAYGPVRTLDKSVLSRIGIQVTYCAGDVAALQDHVTGQTRMLYVESPGSLLLEMLDMRALAAFAREHNLILVTDNTWGTGGIYQPLALGADVSVIAATKYIGGHSDLMLGAVVVSDDGLAAQLDETQYALGYSVSADDVWLAIRGARTLPLRLQQSAASGLAVAQWLQQHPLVERVYFPALPEDPGYALWQRDCRGANGLLSVQLRCSRAQAKAFVDALTYFGIGYSWGGFESLVQLVRPEQLAPHSYWTGGDHALVRLYTGLESCDDLIADLSQALTQITAK